MALEEWVELIVMGVVFVAMAAAALWFSWGLVRMQMPAIQWRYFASIAALVAVCAGCAVYFFQQPSENEEQAALVVLGVVALAGAGVIGYAVHIRKRFVSQIVQWEVVDPNERPAGRDDDAPPGK